jgi:hypothetical protein
LAGCSPSLERRLERSERFALFLGGNAKQEVPMNVSANTKAIRDRIQGKAASRRRAVAMAGAAGFGVAAVVYRTMRGPAG